LWEKDTEIEEFYKKLEDTVSTHREYVTIIIGDWNAKIGSQGFLWSRTVVPNLLGCAAPYLASGPSYGTPSRRK